MRTSRLTFITSTFAVTLLVAACNGKHLDVGTENAKVAPGASTVECPIERCQQVIQASDTVSVDAKPGGLPPLPAAECTYYEGVSAPNGQWWLAGSEDGWELDTRLPGVVKRAGKLTNKTCARDPYAGQGSMPADACDWRYRCEPGGPDPAAACTTATASRTPAPSSLVGTWLLESFDHTDLDTPVGRTRHVPVAQDKPILAVTFAADGAYHAAGCGNADNLGACSASCNRGLRCATGSYSYAAGQLSSTIANHGTQEVASTASGIAIKGFYGQIDWANFVKIDDLPPCE